MQTIELNVERMTCGGCVKHVTKALQGVPGVTFVDVDLVSGRARVQGEEHLSSEALIAALAQEDYSATKAPGTDTQSSAKQGSNCQQKSGGQGGCCCH